jgi:hypothetical protein
MMLLSELLANVVMAMEKSTPPILIKDNKNRWEQSLAASEKGFRMEDAYMRHS